MGLVCWTQVPARFQCPKLTVEPAKVFTDEFDQLWEDNKKDYGIMAVRDKQTLAWRHCEVPSFIGKTYVFACRDEEKLQGHLALQARTEAAGFLSGHYVVTDVFYERSRKEVLYNLMNHAFEFAKARGQSV